MEKLAAKYSYVIVLLVFIIGLWLNICYQGLIDANEGQGHDGVHYYKLTEQMIHKTELIGKSPYLYRLGTPFLVSLLPYDIFTNFLIVNHISTLIGCLLLLYWLSLHFKKKTTGLLVTLGLMANWNFYLRYIQYYPTTCDPLAFIFVILILITLRRFIKSGKKKHAITACSLIFLGVFFREFILVFSFIFLFTHQPFDVKKIFFINWNLLSKNKYWFLLAFSVGVLGNLIAHKLVTTLPSYYSPLKALVSCMERKTIFSLLSGFFNIVGPFVLFPFLFWNQTKAFITKNHDLLIICVLAIGVIWFTGGDTERFVIWFFPVLILPIGLVVEENLGFKSHLSFWIPIAIVMVFTLRLFWQIPSATIETPNSEIPVFNTFQSNFVNMLSFHGTQKFRFIIIAQQLLVFAYVFLWIRLKIIKTNKEKIAAKPN